MATEASSLVLSRPPSPVRSLWQHIVHAYESVQVELHGSYSVERMYHLRTYANTYSLVWCSMVLLLTPFPCVAVAILVDAVPLHPASEGLAHSHTFWMCVMLVGACVTYTILEQLRVFVPRLSHTSTSLLIAMSVIVGFGCSAYGVLMAHYVGYPLPFTIFFGSPSWQVLFWLGVFLIWGRELRQNRALRSEVISFYKVVIVQLSLTAIYPAYNHVFTRLEGQAQTAFALGLPVLKICTKNAFHWVFRHAEDFFPEVAIFNCEVFHALFVSTCMQSSTSIATTAVIMIVDVLQTSVHMMDVDAILDRLKPLDDKRRTSLSANGLEFLANRIHTIPPLTTALLFVGIDRSLHTDPAIRLAAMQPRTNSKPHNLDPPSHPNMAAVHPTEPTRSPSSAPVVSNLQRLTHLFSDHQIQLFEQVLTRDERRQYVATVLSVLHFTEFLVLIEFVEVVVPIVYCSYLIAISYMPNRVFYPQLEHMDTHRLWSTVGRILVYTILELLSFIGLCIVLHRKLRISPVRQLAFVLHKQWKLVQSKMILWVIVIVGTALDQFGYDYTFKFAWLKSKPTP